MEESDSEEQEIDQSILMSQINEQLLVAVKSNKIDDVETLLKKGADVFYAEEDNWPAIMWAANNGNESIVRILIQYGALSQYTCFRDNKLQQMQSENLQTEELSFDPNDEEENLFIKPKNFAKLGRQTPLLWAAFKGYYSLVQLLVNLECSALDFDIHGNNAIHQAAAGGHISILELFINKGVDFEITNARGHTALDLATDPETKNFISKALSSAKCQQCRSNFGFKNLRFFCNSSQKFFCKDCSITTLEYISWESEQKERLVCRSLKVHETIKNQEQNLQEAIQLKDCQNLVNKLTDCESLDIDPKLRKQAEMLQMKIHHEGQIIQFMDNKNHHNDFKSIRSDSKLLDDMVNNAQNLLVDIDENILYDVFQFQQRLKAERNIRKFYQILSNSVDQRSDKTQVDELENLIDIAINNKVEIEYINVAEKLQNKMKGSIKAHEILKLLVEYPERNYPEVKEVQETPQKQTLIRAMPKVPSSSKPPIKKVAPKKVITKKPKEPAFATPAWAESIHILEEKVNQLQILVIDFKVLELDNEFVEEAKIQIKRLNRDIEFRKEEDEKLRIAAEKKTIRNQTKGSNRSSSKMPRDKSLSSSVIRRTKG